MAEGDELRCQAGCTSSGNGQAPQLNFGAPLSVLSTVRAVAVTSTRRTSEVPDAPTATGAGLPGYSLGVW